jgi:hypothetical protein
MFQVRADVFFPALNNPLFWINCNICIEFAGDVGPDGIPGTPGTAGVDGAPGSPGATGPVGEKGL